MKKDIIILGHKGMLGAMAQIFFYKKGYKILTTDARFTIENMKSWRNFIESHPKAVILNCIGKIKQKSNIPSELLWCNSILPLELKNILGDEQILIQPSTDCVFSGLISGKKKVTDKSDANDTYGWSKYLGEIALKGKENSLVIRTSIIGPEFYGSGKGLLGWFLSQKENCQLNGYSNHFWNGITTLEWCKHVDYIITNFDTFKKTDLIQLGTKEVYSKYQVLKFFQETFGTKHEIRKFDMGITIDRSLESSLVCNTFQIQLLELAEYINELGINN